MKHCSGEEIGAYLDGELSAAEQEAVARHLAECAECAAQAARWQNICKALFDAPEASSELVRRVMDRIEGPECESPRWAVFSSAPPAWMAQGIGLAFAIAVLYLSQPSQPSLAETVDMDAVLTAEFSDELSQLAFSDGPVEALFLPDDFWNEDFRNELGDEEQTGSSSGVASKPGQTL